jgi:hypothetical protein
MAQALSFQDYVRERWPHWRCRQRALLSRERTCAGLPPGAAGATIAGAHRDAGRDAREEPPRASAVAGDQVKLPARLQCPGLPCWPTACAPRAN